MLNFLLWKCQVTLERSATSPHFDCLCPSHDVTMQVHKSSQQIIHCHSSQYRCMRALSQSYIAIHTLFGNESKDCLIIIICTVMINCLCAHLNVILVFISKTDSQILVSKHQNKRLIKYNIWTGVATCLVATQVHILYFTKYCIQTRFTNNIFVNQTVIKLYIPNISLK